MKKTLSILSFIVVAALLGGCASTGLTASTHLTNVGLSNNNYRIVATNVSGEASSDGIFGASLGVGMGAAQYSLIPLTPDRTLYKIAMQNLWTNFEAKNGSAVDRTLALTNLRYDSESFNLFFYTKLKVVVIADVVEFK
jgi:hypothetical protein